MTGPMRLAPAGMLLAATLALAALVLPLDLSLGAGAVPPSRATPTPSVATRGPAEIPVIVRLRISALRLKGEPAAPEDALSPYSSVSPSWLHARAIATRESLSEISRATGVSAAAQTTAGRASSGVLVRPGQALVQRATDAMGRTVSLPLRAHTVAQGESLWGISQDAGVSVDAVVAANNLPDHATLRPGQVIMIPAPDLALIPEAAAANVSALSWNGLSTASWTEFASSRTHTVAPGESVWAIAQETGVSLGALMTANNLSEGSVLHSGELLVIPAPDPIPAPMAPTAPATPSPNLRTSALGGSEHTAGSGSAPRTYTVAFGDTLWDVARDAGVSLGEILAVNQISETDTIHPGDILVLPRSARDPALSSSRVSDQLSVLSSMDGVSMVWPTTGRITSPFGPRTHPIFHTHEFHTGVDIGARWHSDVRAALSGIVRFAGSMGGYGRIIILDHGNGLETAYSHLDRVLVIRGQRVEQRELIGLVGSTGWSTGPHVLFEVRKNGRPVNPIDYLHP
jgi:murein DD-endopeptidase MepM/ murein hydrolase activator NlpD